MMRPPSTDPLSSPAPRSASPDSPPALNLPPASSSPSHAPRSPPRRASAPPTASPPSLAPLPKSSFAFAPRDAQEEGDRTPRPRWPSQVAARASPATSEKTDGLATPRGTQAAPLRIRDYGDPLDAGPAGAPPLVEAEAGGAAGGGGKRPAPLARTRTFVSYDSLVAASLSPPSPVAFPGGWRRGETEAEGEDDEGLWLPPPFLADESSRESFDGLLGTRLHRSRQRLQAQHERLASLGRAPPPPFPGNVVKGATKLLRLLGPPGGFSSLAATRAGAVIDDEADEDERRELRDSEKRRRRVKRAESGVRAYEISAEVGRRVAGRLERHRSARGRAELVLPLPAKAEESKENEGKEAPRQQRMRAATPSQLLGMDDLPPPAFPLSPLDIPSSPTFLPLSPLDINVLPELSRPPSAPNLVPLSVPLSNPMPTIATPFSLDSLDPLANDYFDLKRRGSTKRRRKSSLVLSPIPDKEENPPSPSTSSSAAPRSPYLVAPIAPPTVLSRTLDLLIYLLIGPSPSPSSALPAPLALGGLLGLLIHIPGFAFFVAYHALALVVASGAALRVAGVWTYWAGLNLSGRTEVSRKIREYGERCLEEWVDEGRKQGKERLGAVAVVRGLAELAVLQTMTRSRHLRDGPGDLVLLTPTPSCPPTPHFPPSRRRRFSLELDRPTLTQRQTSYLWTGGKGDERDGEGLVVEKQDGGVMEGSIISHESKQRRHFQHRASRKADSTNEPPPFSLEESSSPRRPSQTALSPHLSPLALPSSHASPQHLLSGHITASPPLLPIPEDPSTPLSSLVDTLKRHCRLATASYGLHTYIVDAPTPLLTPSGATLPHRVFAHLGGVRNHQDVLHVALQKRYSEVPPPKKGSEAKRLVDPYAPQFYLLRDDVEGEIVVVIRGTQTLADVKTDLDGDFVDFSLPSPHPPCSPSTSRAPSPPPPETASSSASSSPTYRIHSGMLLTAQHLLSPSSSPPSPLFAKLAAVLAQHPAYSLVFTGHSLGAALASTLALLLSVFDEERGEWILDPQSELAKAAAAGGAVMAEDEAQRQRQHEHERPEEEEAFRRPVRAVCFAHPTTVNQALAARCALSASFTLSSTPSMSSTPTSTGAGTPLVVNVSLGADVITRMGLPQVRALRRAVGRLEQRRGAAEKAKEEGLLSEWWRWRKCEEGERAEEKEQREERAWEVRKHVERWEEEDREEGETAVPAGKAYHLDRLPPDVEAQQRLERGDAAGGDADGEPLFGLYEVRDPRRFYRLPHLEADCVAAHMPKVYLDAVDSL
ncbi:hypothetical protein JCM10207_000432 [Rhodosporidiobolus poonsookiae]